MEPLALTFQTNGLGRVLDFKQVEWKSLAFCAPRSWFWNYRVMKIFGFRISERVEWGFMGVKFGGKWVTNFGNWKGGDNLARRAPGFKNVLGWLQLGFGEIGDPFPPKMA